MFDRRSAPAERRRAARAPLVASVKERVGSLMELALAQDVGPTGMKLKRLLGRSYSPRTTMAMAFELPDGGGLVQVRGAVVFERAEGSYQMTGVRFEDLSPVDYARILRYISRPR
jgi:hypothetical protein